MSGYKDFIKITRDVIISPAFIQINADPSSSSECSDGIISIEERNRGEFTTWQRVDTILTDIEDV